MTDGMDSKEYQYGVCRRLTIDEEQEMCARKDNGDREAFNRLVESVTPYVISLARKMARHPDDVDDLTQCGLLIVMECLRSFDATKGRLTTYVTNPIQWRLIRIRDCNSSVIYHPPYPRAEVPTQKYVPSFDDLSSRSKSDVDVVDDKEEFDHEYNILLEAMRSLPQRSQEIMEKRMNKITFNEIGESLGLSKERVRQIEYNAIRKIRSMILRKA